MRQSALRATEADWEKAFLLTENPIDTSPSPKASAAELDEALGWIGVGIGIAELLMPRTVAGITGLPPPLVRTLGTLALVASAGRLLQPREPAWRWSRVASDLTDLSLLAWAARRRSTDRSQLITALHAGMTTLDLLIAYDSQWRASRQSDLTASLRVYKSLHIQRPPEACYRFWRNFENFPKFMSNVESVQLVDATRTRWRMRTTRGGPVEWTTELFSDIPSQQLGWRTIADSPLEHSGAQVRRLHHEGKS